ncbi:MAG: alpha/beta fold hydrolase [Deltaproteobacteria bacterium]|nr:alpha/beta fold hydrolase [Deltaproteobacteria bacterium]
MPTVTTAGAKLYYEEAGAGSAVVLAHGGGGDLSQWRHQVPALAAHHRVIAFDARGHGRSAASTPPGRITDFADDIAELLRHLGIARAHLIGATLGGVAVLEFALARPAAVQSLVLISTAPDTTEEMRLRFEASAEVVESGDLAGFAEGFISFIFSSDFADSHPDDLADFRQRLERIDPAGYAASIRALGNRPDLTPRLGQLRVPALIVTGALDPIPTSAPGAALLAQALPNARNQVIPDAAHLPQIERPDLFNRLVLDFFAAAERQAAGTAPRPPGAGHEGVA